MLSHPFHRAQLALASAAAAAVLGACHAALADAPPDPGAHVPVPARIELRAGGAAFAGTGDAECRLDREARRDGLRVSHYSVRYGADGWRLELDVWQSRTGGPDVIALRLATAERTYTIDSADGARATFERRRLGGAFTVEGRTADGATVAGAVECSRFTGIVAERG